MGDNLFDEVYEMHDGSETRELYNRWAQTYNDDLVGGGYAQPARAAAALKGLGLGPEAQILDVGCGTGLSGVALANDGFTAIDGCDYSIGMLEIAEQTGVYGRLFEADLNDPPIEVVDDQYDAATVVGVFGFGHVMPDALDEILRLISPGGALVIAVNETFYDDGALPAKIVELQDQGRIQPATSEYGEHIPGRDLGGWVIATRKAAAAAAL